MNEPAETLASEGPRPAWWAGPWPLAVFFFAWCLFFYTRNYQHPYYYEKDATTKVQQVMGGERNYFHPLLMLNTTDALIYVSGTPRTDQNVSDVGHLVMAVFGALSVATFVLLAFRCGGWVAAFAVGVLLSLNDQLLSRAHYFKEDPALLVGLAFSFLAMKLFHQRPTLGRAAWLGAACAVAIAGKYVGVAALILAIPLVLMPPGARLARLGALIGVCLLVVLAIDWQWIADFNALRQGVHTQMHDLLGREEMVRKIPHIRMTVDIYKSGLPKCVAIGLFLQVAYLVYAACIQARGAATGVFRRIGEWFRCAWREWPVEWMLIVYPLIYTIILVWTPRLFERHFLPVFICLWASSGLGWVNGLRWLGQKFPRLPAPSAAAAAILAIVICASQLKRTFFHRSRDFAIDHRALLAEWIRANVPADAVIAQDRRVYLLHPDGSPRPDLALPQRIISVGWLSEFGSLEELRKRGVTHLAMHKLDSGGFMKGGKFRKGVKESFSGRDRPARHTFYREIEANSRRVWEREDGDDGAMNPGLLFYALEPKK